MQVGLGPGHIGLDGDPAPLLQRGTAPNFGQYMLWQMAVWIEMPLGREVGLGRGHIVLDGDLAPPPKKRAQQPSTFRPMFTVAKRSPISATAELLSCFSAKIHSKKVKYVLLQMYNPALLEHKLILTTVGNLQPNASMATFLQVWCSRTRGK